MQITQRLDDTEIDKGDVLDHLLDSEFTSRLNTLGKESAERYKNAPPFPHIYFDNFLPELVADAALSCFPGTEAEHWDRYRDPNQHHKAALSNVESLPASVRNVLYFLNSRPMLRFLEDLTGIQAIVPDPYFEGGGLHQIKTGGFLEVHTDFSYSKKLRLNRRINVLVYLNKDWKEEYGGHFELWDRKITKAEQRILPIFNRCAIFSTTSQSFHGHPNPLKCPTNRTRNSIATYYYSNGRPEEEVGLTTEHGTIFKSRPEFNKVNAIVGTKKLVKSLIPPIVTDLYRGMRHK